MDDLREVVHPQNVWNKPCRLLPVFFLFSFPVLTHPFSIQGLLSMLEKDKVEKGQDMYSPDLYDDNYAKCKTPSSISAADMYCYCSQRLHKSSFPYVKILVPAIFFLKIR